MRPSCNTGREDQIVLARVRPGDPEPQQQVDRLGQQGLEHHLALVERRGWAGPRAAEKRLGSPVRDRLRACFRRGFDSAIWSILGGLKALITRRAPADDPDGMMAASGPPLAPGYTPGVVC